MEKSSFFNSVQASDGSYDREYLAEDFAKYFSSFIGNGVFPNPSTNLQVLSNNNMTISISIGKAYINGYYYENTTKLVKTIDVADGVSNRIDLVVLRLDYINREIKVYVKEGTFASSPKAETLQRDSDMYELGLAEVYVKSGATTITQANITDLRLDSNSCGVVSNLVTTVDATTLYNKYETLFNNKIIKNQEDFNDWFVKVKDFLDENVAVKLQNEIGDLNNLQTNIKTDLVSSINENKNSINNFDEELGSETLITSSKTLKGAINEVFTNGNNVKKDTVNALLAKDSSLAITTTSPWNTIISSISKIKTSSLNKCTINAGAFTAGGKYINGFPMPSEYKDCNYILVGYRDKHSTNYRLVIANMKLDGEWIVKGAFSGWPYVNINNNILDIYFDWRASNDTDYLIEIFFIKLKF